MEKVHSIWKEKTTGISSCLTDNSRTENIWLGSTFHSLGMLWMDEYLTIQVQYFGKLSLVQEKVSESFIINQRRRGGNSLGRHKTLQISSLLSRHTQVYLWGNLCASSSHYHEMQLTGSVLRKLQGRWSPFPCLMFFHFLSICLENELTQNKI